MIWSAGQHRLALFFSHRIENRKGWGDFIQSCCFLWFRDHRYYGTDTMFLFLFKAFIEILLININKLLWNENMNNHCFILISLMSCTLKGIDLKIYSFSLPYSMGNPESFFLFFFSSFSLFSSSEASDTPESDSLPTSSTCFSLCGSFFSSSYESCSSKLNRNFPLFSFSTTVLFILLWFIFLKSVVQSLCST